MQLGNMIYHQAPEELWRHIVIGVNNTVSATDLSINLYFCTVYLVTEDGVANSLVLHKVYLTA